MIRLELLDLFARLLEQFRQVVGLLGLEHIEVGLDIDIFLAQRLVFFCQLVHGVQHFFLLFAPVRVERLGQDPLEFGDDFRLVCDGLRVLVHIERLQLRPCGVQPLVQLLNKGGLLQVRLLELLCFGELLLRLLELPEKVGRLFLDRLGAALLRPERRLHFDHQVLHLVQGHALELLGEHSRLFEPHRWLLERRRLLSERCNLAPELDDLDTARFQRILALFLLGEGLFRLGSGIADAIIGVLEQLLQLGHLERLLLVYVLFTIL